MGHMCTHMLVTMLNCRAVCFLTIGLHPFLCCFVVVVVVQLWALLMPLEELADRYSKQWDKIGFQGKNPATAFRGMGILGLHCLMYVHCCPDLACLLTCEQFCL